VTSEEAVKLLNDLAMAILEHTYMKNAAVLLEAQDRKLDEASAAKMNEIRQHAVDTARTTVTTLLTEILDRLPTDEEVRGVTSVLDDTPPPYLRSPLN
jgi:hypothetical protein